MKTSGPISHSKAEGVANAHRVLDINGELLRRLREDRGLTLDELAGRTRLDARQLGKYERGEVRYTHRADTRENLSRLAEFYGMASFESLLAPAQRGQPEAAPAPGGGFDPSCYVERRGQAEAQDRLRGPRSPLALYGPYRFGKRTLLGHLLAEAQSGPNPARVLHLDFSAIGEDALGSLDNLLRGMGLHFLEGLASPLARPALRAASGTGRPPSAAPWKGDADSDPYRVAAARLEEAFRGPGNNERKLTRHILERQVLLAPGAEDQRVLLAIEHVDRLQSRPYKDRFFGLLRSWVEDQTRDCWSRLRLVVTVSTDPYVLESTDHSSFFALTNPMIRLDDPREFDDDQLRRLAALHNLHLSDQGLRMLLDLVGRHPYLTRVALHGAATKRVPLDQFLSDPSLWQSVYQLHLTKVRDFLARHEPLRDGLRRLFQDPHTPASKVDPSGLLYSRGLIIEREDRKGELQPRCRLYDEHLRRIL